MTPSSDPRHRRTSAPPDGTAGSPQGTAHSLLMSSAGRRITVALGLVLALWLAVAWALSGTP